MNRDKYLTVIFLFFIALAASNLPGCSDSEKNSNMALSAVEQDKHDPIEYNGENNRIEKFSEEKKYKVSLYTENFPLPTGKIHTWTLDVKTPDGQPVENVKIYVHGGMPVHQHGFPTSPRITEYLGNGRYLVDGVKFSMVGDWEMRFNIKEEKKNKRDRVIFNIKI